ncbi:MAG: hypothetical protein PHQ23_02645, partial [Candidatus Wallbacteria bacterium]|nr:hypothetical protein [Candidatus Wallbacteria bacterium]
SEIISGPLPDEYTLTQPAQALAALLDLPLFPRTRPALDLAGPSPGSARLVPSLQRMHRLALAAQPVLMSVTFVLRTN